MATNFPTSVDSLVNPVSNDSLNSPSHSAQHANANDAIEAIETSLLPSGTNYPSFIHLYSTTFTNQSTVDVDNIFTANYNVYEINMVLSGTVSGPWQAQLILKTSSGVDTLTNYFYNGATSTQSALTNTVGSSAAFWRIGAVNNSETTSIRTRINNPFDAAYKTHYFNTMQSQNDVTNDNMAGLYNTLKSHTGFRIQAQSGNITGQIRVCGLRNS